MVEVSKIITIIVAVVLTLGVVLGFIFQTTQLYSNGEVGTSCTKNTWCQLQKDLVQTGTLVVGNGTGSKILTETTEYIVDYNLGKVNITNTTGTATFNFSYNYANHNYMTRASDRSVAGVLGIGVAIGLLVLIFMSISKKV